MPAANSQPVVNLCPPQPVVDLAQQVMGQIDLDAWSSPYSGRITQASRGYDHTALDLEQICAMDWEPPAQGRTLVAVPSGTANGRRLANKALKELRAGRIQEAVLWLGANESVLSLPWLWDHLVLIPFRRLRPLAWEPDLETFYSVSSGSWSLVAYLPPAGPEALRLQRIARFYTCAAAIGRVIADGSSGDSDWELAYEAAFRRPYCTDA